MVTKAKTTCSKSATESRASSAASSSALLRLLIEARIRRPRYTAWMRVAQKACVCIRRIVWPRQFFWMVVAARPSLAFQPRETCPR